MIRRIAPLAALAFLAGCATRPPLASVPTLDLERYQGRWYEVARFDHFFERGLTRVTATYEPRPDGTVSVVNAGIDGDGQAKSITGSAWRPDSARPAVLHVRFFWPFWASYWVIALDSDYQWAVVGHPSRGYLWFLSRQPIASPAAWTAMEAAAIGQGYDLGGLIRVRQDG